MEKLPEILKSYYFFETKYQYSSAENSPLTLDSRGTFYFSSMNTKTPVTLDGSEKEYRLKSTKLKR